MAISAPYSVISLTAVERVGAGVRQERSVRREAATKKQVAAVAPGERVIGRATDKTLDHVRDGDCDRLFDRQAPAITRTQRDVVRSGTIEIQGRAVRDRDHASV